jgi:hydroxyacylglutathione hydrolase
VEVERLVVGKLQTNCYLASCSKTGEAVVIDPGDDGGFIIQKILDLKLRPKFILATHGHFDHVLAVTELKLAFRIPFLIHKDDIFLLKRLRETANYFLGYDAYPEVRKPDVDGYLNGDAILSFGGERLKIVETPGHTPGGVCFYGVGALFAGDTLFHQGLGRTDLSYSSFEELTKSLEKLSKLPGETVVYPGHGSETTIVAEKQSLVC